MPSTKATCSVKNTPRKYLRSNLPIYKKGRAGAKIEVLDKRAKRITEASAFRAGSVPPMLPAPKELIMKIKVEYDESAQTQWICGNFIFVKEADGRIHNLEARW